MTQKVGLHQRLTARVLIFLTIALVPLGIISVVQNHRLDAEIDRRTALSLQALTEQAASGERLAIQRSFGNAELLAANFDGRMGQTDNCPQFVQDRTGPLSEFAYVGLISAEGWSVCSSDPQVLDFSDSQEFQDYAANPRPYLSVARQGAASGQAVLIFSHPLFDDEGFAGFVSLSTPIETIMSQPDFLGEAEPITLITFNADGLLMTSDVDLQMTEALLPNDVALADLTGGYARTFSGTSRSGRDLSYSVVPIIPDVAYALGLWGPDADAGNASLTPLTSTLLPFLMWLASLFVAWFVIDRFVVNRIADLNRDMVRFANNRTLPKSTPMNVSSELEELNASFMTMASRILRDEAKLEDQVREKSILLKEIHHRVKNNLQIISSIMNMQIRKADEAETRSTLRQVQDRILGLSSVHQTLYQTESLSRLDAADLIRELITQGPETASALSAGIDIRLDLTSVTILPDQAVPFTMLLSECVSNARKYVGGANPTIEVGLRQLAAQNVEMIVENSTDGTVEPQHEPGYIPGLGRQLIRAFCAQLNGSLKVTEPEGLYRIEVVFEVETSKLSQQDF
ncbi:sensor histidine kinase [Pseudooctadecabacter jejudonensis]|uniref:histidine kinase n=1 Tax=Pseudooctadecabacter jejudonensis TaxID=1391910 RepID=A0A1Y5TB95_9RHOB|nr:sensor histidine kinase [Pseudooctadecabacter jejudonensis]SLN58039.1 putative sensor histidine kinase pdtaS [Pseudooctadecabacter jejudonensis]